MDQARLPAHLKAAVDGDARVRTWCVEAVDHYVHGTLAHGGPRYTGSRFEDLGREDGDVDRITPADLLAVTMLDVAVPADAAIRILGPAAEEITALLGEIDSQADLHEVEVGAVSDTAPAGQLWTLLRAFGSTVPGSGPTTTSKLLARKRPRLLPIWDRVVGEQLGLVDHRDHWREVHRLLQEPSLVELLRSTREGASSGHLALLRVLDILLWMSDARRYDGPTVGDAD